MVKNNAFLKRFTYSGNEYLKSRFTSRTQYVSGQFAAFSISAGR